MEKKLKATVAELRDTYPDAHLRVWAEDEHRLGLQPIIRSVWVQQGYSPVAMVKPKYQGLWGVGVVEPVTGETYWWLVPKLNTEVMNQLLGDFAEHFGVDETHRVLLVMDQAGFHTSKDLKVPKGMHLLYLPPSSPELQPAERLWSWTDEGMVNRHFDTLDELEEVMVNRCQALMEQTDLIQGLTGFHWWLEALI